MTSLVSEAIASVGDVTSNADDVISGTAPAMDSTNETAAQTDTAPNAIYIDGICCDIIKILFDTPYNVWNEIWNKTDSLSYKV